MALDTRNQRASAIHVGLPWRHLLPAPDALVGDGDRRQAAALYRIPAGADGPPTHLVIPDVGEAALLEILAAALAALGAQVRLFQGEEVPSFASVLADLLECDFDGYAPRALTSGVVRGAPELDGSRVIDWRRVTWANGGGAGSNSVGGYYVVTPGPPVKLLWLQAFAAPVVMEADEPGLAFRPRLALKSLYGG